VGLEEVERFGSRMDIAQLYGCGSDQTLASHTWSVIYAGRA
jgi:hypothetical protein